MSAVSALGVDIGDPDSTRTVWAVVALLVVMGLGLVMVAFWLRRSTRPDPDFLAPLELMGERAWRRGDPVWQRRRLDEVRPEGAEPLRRSAAPPRVDESFDEGPTGAGFDDLRDDGDDDRAVVLPVRQVDSGDADDADDKVDSQDAARLDPASGSDADDDKPDDDAADHDAADDDEADDDAADDDEADDPTRTPTGASRPYLDDLPDHEFDPVELRQAMEQLDAELHRNVDD